MSGRRTEFLALVLSVGLCSACARNGPAQRSVVVPTAEAVPLAVLKPFVIPGEQITWQVTFRGIEGARARMAVGVPAVVDGRRLVNVVAEAETSGLAALVKNLR